MFKKILIAIDSSEYSKQIIPSALEVARKFGSEAFVLHVAEHDRGRASAYSTETSAEATALVADAVKLLRDASVTAKGEVHDVGAGHVAKNIVETAAAEGSDLIVMGSRGLSDVEGLFLGSVTHKVIQLTHVAVLVARGGAAVKAEQPALVHAAATA